MTSDPPPVEVDAPRVSVQEELAAMVGEHAERTSVAPTRRPKRTPRLGGAAADPTSSPADPEATAALAQALDEALARRLPELLDESLARALPAHVERAVEAALQRADAERADRDAEPADPEPRETVSPAELQATLLEALPDLIDRAVAAALEEVARALQPPRAQDPDKVDWRWLLRKALPPQPSAADPEGEAQDR